VAHARLAEPIRHRSQAPWRGVRGAFPGTAAGMPQVSASFNNDGGIPANGETNCPVLGNRALVLDLATSGTLSGHNSGRRILACFQPFPRSDRDTAGTRTPRTPARGERRPTSEVDDRDSHSFPLAPRGRRHRPVGPRAPAVRRRRSRRAGCFGDLSSRGYLLSMSSDSHSGHRLPSCEKSWYQT
jgi:hypothetical protein